MNALVWPLRTKRAVWRDYVVIPFLINVALNAVLPFVFFGHYEFLPVEGASPTVLREVIATAILLPAITALVCWPLIRKDVRSGKWEMPTCVVEEDQADASGHRVRSLLSIGLIKAGHLMSIHWLVAALLTTALWGPVIYGVGRLALLLIDRPVFTLIQLSVFKAGLAGLGGMGVAPFLFMSLLAYEADRRIRLVGHNAAK